MLEKEILIAGHKLDNVKISTEADQDFLIMSKLLRITKTVDFEPEELEYYNWMSENMNDTGHFARGFRLTDDPTEEEVKVWQEGLEFLNKMDFAAIRTKVEFYDREEEGDPYSESEDLW